METGTAVPGKEGETVLFQIIEKKRRQRDDQKYDRLRTL